LTAHSGEQPEMASPRLALRNARQLFQSGDFADVIDATASGAMDLMLAAHQIVGIDSRRH
jgi:hypothetical protein